MRLFLLPVSSRRTLLYCERLEPAGQQAAGSASMVDKATAKAAKLWSDWEHKPAGTWQHRIVSSGNAGLRRIAFEEWGLKSVPPLSSRQKAEAASRAAAEDAKTENKEGTDIVEAASKLKLPPVVAAVEVVYPSSVIADKDVAGVLHRLSSERDALHRKRLLWCFVGMPISAPFGLVPVIPNIPFFYLAFRAWSHWRALAGGKHVQHLLQNSELVYRPSPILDAIYGDAKKSPFASEKLAQAAAPEERLLISHPEGSKAVARAFDSPALELELERAIWQVESALNKEKAVKQQQEKQEKQKQEQQPREKVSEPAAQEKAKQ